MREREQWPVGSRVVWLAYAKEHRSHPGLTRGDDASARRTLELLRRPYVDSQLRRHAQELDEDVIWPYVELYVNDHTVDLGSDGARALTVLGRTAREAGVIPTGLPPLRLI